MEKTDDPMIIPKLGLRPGSHTRRYYKRRLNQFFWKTEDPTSFQPIPVSTKLPYEEKDWLLKGKQERFPASVLKKYPGADSITFSINGTSHTVTSADVSPHTKLAEYLRYSLGLTGTKIGCHEGGCGSCTVTISKSSNDGSTVNVVANSCLRPVLSLDGASITTVEGIGSTLHGLHPIQSEVAKCDASQCGYCTPGFVMSMYGLLAQNSKPNPKQIEEHFQGNICRCTGYRPILKAMHNIGRANMYTNKSNKSKSVDKECTQQTNEGKSDQRTAISCFVGSDAVWFNPTNLADVYALLKEHGSRPTRLVCGNTSIGVTKYFAPHPGDDPEVFINIANIPRLTQITSSSDAVSFGASVTLSQLILTLENMGKSKTDKKFLSLVSHLRKVAHPMVRDVGSWAGNVMMTKTHIDFPSDVVTVLIAAGAVVTIASGTDTKVLDLADFMSYNLPNDMLLYSMRIPFAETNEVFDTYKAMERHANSAPLLNAGFSFLIDNNKIIDCRLVYGGIIRGPLQCSETAKALIGKDLSLSLLQTALPILKAECTPTTPSVTDPNFPTTDPIYRQNLAKALFYKFFLFSMVSVYGVDSIDKRLISATVDYERPMSTAKQVWPPAPISEAPVGVSVPKIDGTLQASGEARFTSDLPKSVGTLFAVPVLTTKVGVKITSINASAALAMTGVKAFISSQDVKDIGADNKIANTGYTIFATASDKVSYVGQFVGLILATTFTAAHRAVQLVEVTYSITVTGRLQRSQRKGVDPAPLTFKHALRTGATAQISHSVSTPGRGAGSGDRAVTASISTTGQKHFYMETQTTLAVPGEGGIVVHSSTQHMTSLRVTLASTLNKPASQITISNTRCGGAYGGKAFLDVPTAAAACVAALKMGVPVLFQLSRNDDMSSLGSRAPAAANFTTSFNASSKKITSLQLEVKVDAGDSTVHGSMNCTSLNSYSVPGAKLNSQAVRTASPTNTIMRAPGDFQGAFFMEAVIEAIARDAGVDPLVVQEANLQSSCVETWNYMKTTANINQKQADVTSFNAQNQWRKRGLYCTSTVYDISSMFTGESVIVNILADGSVNVDHSGIEVGQGINTKVIQAACMELGQIAPVQLSLAHTLAPKTTEHFSSATPTWSSTTSEACVGATITACKKLVSILHKYQTGGIDWKNVVKAAYAKGEHLSATGAFNIGLSGASYKVFGAAATMVELDVLTGECSILSADIFIDCGVSLNPGVDIGQVEGSFIQGAGFCLSEEQIRSSTDGRLITNGTFVYKPPSVLDIPIDFNVTIVKSTNDVKNAVLGSKASGEPSQLLGIGPFYALKMAIYAAREDQGHKEYFQLDVPATPVRTQRAALINW